MKSGLYFKILPLMNPTSGCIVIACMILHCVYLFPAAPSVPLNLIVTDTTASTVSLQWSEPELANGIITNYIVQFYQPSDPSAVTVFSDSSVATSITVDGLDAFTQYTFRVAAMTVERGPFAEINATTAESGICTCII